MSWRRDFQLATPECLRQFIKELISTELISEQEKLKICAQDCGSHVLAERDMSAEMDLRHLEAKITSAENIAQMKIPKHELMREARRRVSEEEIFEKNLKHQTAAYKRELRIFEDDLKKSRGGPDLRQRRSSSAFKSTHRKSLLAKRPKSTGEIELRLNELKLAEAIKDQEEIEPEPLASAKSDSSSSSSGSSAASTITILSKNEYENIVKADNNICLPPLNVALKPKTPPEPKVKSGSAEERETLKRYWFIWRTIVFRRMSMEKLNRSNEETMIKIDQFLFKFKEEKAQQVDFFTVGANSPNPPDEIKRKVQLAPMNRSGSKRTKSCSNLESIIKDQKAKLREQEKLITKLKLEQLRLEAEKSRESTQEHAERALQQSSLPIKRKLGYLRSSFPNILDKHHYEKPRPSFLVQMEKRQKERLRRKEELKERTRLKIIEQKRLQREKEEARKAEIAEQKRLDHELKLEQMRLEAEKRANEQAAAAFCRLRRMRMAFGLFRGLLDERQRRLVHAEVARETKLLSTAFAQWRLVTRLTVQEKIAEAKRHHQDTLLRYSWNKWRIMAMDAKRDRQVAEDFYDLTITDAAFTNWRAAARTSYEEMQAKELEAELFHERLIMRKSWLAWKKFQIIQDEERRLEKKRESLRNVVRIILPDFRPTFVESVLKEENQL